MNRLRELVAVLLLLAVPVASLANALGLMYCSKAGTEHSQHAGHENVAPQNGPGCDCGCHCGQHCAVSCLATVKLLARVDLAFGCSPVVTLAATATTLGFHSTDLTPPFRPPILSG